MHATWPPALHRPWQITFAELGPNALGQSLERLRGLPFVSRLQLREVPSEGEYGAPNNPVQRVDFLIDGVPKDGLYECELWSTRLRFRLAESSALALSHKSHAGIHVAIATTLRAAGVRSYSSAHPDPSDSVAPRRGGMASVYTCAASDQGKAEIHRLLAALLEHNIAGQLVPSRRTFLGSAASEPWLELCVAEHRAYLAQEIIRTQQTLSR